MRIFDTDVADESFGKADFSDIYRKADPREYFRVLCGLDYIIPELAKTTFRSVIEARAASQNAPVKVLDLGCSYGINSALTQYPLDIQRLSRRYACPEMYRVSPEHLKDLDKTYYASWPKQHNSEFYGVDTSIPATAYAKAVGLIKAAVNNNLETGNPSDADRAILQDVDVIISTGCVGYISHRTFAQIFRCRAGAKRRPPLVAAFVLRMYSYDTIAAELSRHGLITEKLEGVTFVQRRISTRHEFDTTLKRLHAMGISPAGKESEGLLHAELFISRTEDAIRRTPINKLVSVTNGNGIPYGRRFRHVEGDEAKLMH